MKVTPSEVIPDVLIIEPDIHRDLRGSFLELYHEERYRGIVAARFVQDNVSRSRRGVLRGLHFQTGTPQGKLVTVIEGLIFDVAVDLRRGSPTFGAHAAMTLSAENPCQIYIPDGFAHGFLDIGDFALVSYTCTALYDPAGERGVRWNDPTLSIAWPVIVEPILSEKDAALPTLSSIPPDELPVFAGGEAV
jgi:dTDP-4-dehydrorhamnose 3,5-epimerase